MVEGLCVGINGDKFNAADFVIYHVGYGITARSARPYDLNSRKSLYFWGYFWHSPFSILNWYKNSQKGILWQEVLENIFESSKKLSISECHISSAVFRRIHPKHCKAVGNRVCRVLNIHPINIFRRFFMCADILREERRCNTRRQIQIMGCKQFNFWNKRSSSSNNNAGRQEFVAPKFF